MPQAEAGGRGETLAPRADLHGVLSQERTPTMLSDAAGQKPATEVTNSTLVGGPFEVSIPLNREGGMRRQVAHVTLPKLLFGHPADRGNR